MGYFMRPGGDEGVATAANYAALPATANAGDWATTTNTEQVWRYNSVTGCWVPEQMYSASTAVLDDASGNTLDFRSPAVSDFTGLDGYTHGKAGGGSPSAGDFSDLSPGIKLINSSYIGWERESYSGLALAIIDIDTTMTGTSTFLFAGIAVQKLTKIIYLNTSGSGGATSNNAGFHQTYNAAGTIGRGRFTYVAGTRLFFTWSDDEISTPTGNNWFELIGQDSSVLCRGAYDEARTVTSTNPWAWTYGPNNGSTKIYRLSFYKLA